MLISCDQKQAHFKSYDSSGKRSLILGLSWFLYSLGSYLDPNLSFFSEMEHSQLITVQIWQVGLRVVCCLVLITLVHFYSKSDSFKLSLCIAPSLAICTLMGTVLNNLDNIRFDLTQDHRRISILQDSEKVIGVARVIDYRQHHQSCTYTLMIQNIQKPTFLEFDSSTAPIAKTWQTLCESVVEKNSSLWFKGRFNWTLGQSAQPLRRKQTRWRQDQIAWSFKGDLSLKDIDHNLQIHQLFQDVLESTFKKVQESTQKDYRHGIALLKGIILGEARALSPKLLRRIRYLGLGHLLAVSGLHIGVCAFLFAWAFRRISHTLGAKLPILWGVAAMISAAWFYVALAHAPTSAKRAAWMITFWGAGQISFWPLSALESLWLAVWSLTISQPSAGQEMGLQLSLFATLGLHTCLTDFEVNQLYKSKKKNLNRKSILLIRWAYSILCSSLKVACLAWFFTLPILVWHLGVITPWSIPFNTLITPVVSATFIPFSLLASLFCPIWDWPLIKCIELAQMGSDLILKMNMLPYSELMLSSNYAYPLFSLLFAYYVWHHIKKLDARQWSKHLLLDVRFLTQGLPVKIEHRAVSIAFYQKLSCCLVILAFSLTFFIYERNQRAQISFLYVGQGDATLIRNHRGEHALFDVGPLSAARSLTNTLKRQGVNQIDWIAISHLHPDHYGALAHLLQSFKIHKVIYHGRDFARNSLSDLYSQQRFSLNANQKQSGVFAQDHKLQPTLGSWEEVKALLNKYRVPLLRTQEFQELLDNHQDWGGLKLTWVLGSFEEDRVEELSENDASLALLITSKKERILLSGDLEKKGELRLQKRWTELYGSQVNLTVWQANHHGSRTSSSPFLIDTLQPRELIYSLDGLHKFSFPHPEVVKRFSERAIRQIRLDLRGDYILEL